MNVEVIFLFFSSRRRHTICALVTGVQTCALPIFPVRLRAAREAAGLSQGQVAKLMNMHRPTISEMEAGNRRITADELAKLADLYDTKLSWLLGDAPERAATDDPKQIGRASGRERVCKEV